MQTTSLELLELDENKLEALYQQCPNGRPLTFCTSANGGFSLVAAIANLFERIGLCEKTPGWVRLVCKEVQEQKINDGSITGTIKFLTQGGYRDVPNRGTLIRANFKDERRIALLLDLEDGKSPKGWLVAVWDRKTGQRLSFPEIV